MASGFGYTGGPSRCFPYWQEFAKCFAQADGRKECRMQAEDYLECLHHKKEMARARAVRAEFVKHAAHVGAEGRKAADIIADGAIVSLGLIARDADEKDNSHEASRPEDKQTH